MTDAEIADLVRRTLFEVAPDLAGEEIEPDTPFRDQFEIDSMDFLNFVTGLAAATGVEVPETDYPRLQTLSDCVAYLSKG